MSAERTAKADAAASANIIKSITQYEKELDFAQLVATMRAHAGNVDAQEQGCRALVNLTVNYDNKVKAGSAGAVEAVVAAMRAHASNAGVQEQGCLALRNMTGNNDANQVKAGSAGAIEAVVAAMRAHASNAGVQEEGKIVLDRLKR